MTGAAAFTFDIFQSVCTIMNKKLSVMANALANLKPGVSIKVAQQLFFFWFSEVPHVILSNQLRNPGLCRPNILFQTVGGSLILPSLSINLHFSTAKVFILSKSFLSTSCMAVNFEGLEDRAEPLSSDF